MKTQSKDFSNLIIKHITFMHKRDTTMTRSDLRNLTNELNITTEEKKFIAAAIQNTNDLRTIAEYLIYTIEKTNTFTFKEFKKIFIGAF